MAIRLRKRVLIVWGIVVIVIFGTLTLLGFKLAEKNKPYKELEDKLLRAAQAYTDENYLYDDANSGLKLTYKELHEADYIDELKVEEDVCDGYVEVIRKGAFEYKEFIKCSKYETKGYKS